MAAWSTVTSQGKLDEIEAGGHLPEFAIVRAAGAHRNQDGGDFQARRDIAADSCDSGGTDIRAAPAARQNAPTDERRPLLIWLSMILRDT
jgi:hypothetical protein